MNIGEAALGLLWGNRVAFRALYAPIDRELDREWPRTLALGSSQLLPIAFAVEWAMEPYFGEHRSVESPSSVWNRTFPGSTTRLDSRNTPKDPNKRVGRTADDTELCIRSVSGNRQEPPRSNNEPQRVRTAPNSPDYPRIAPGEVAPHSSLQCPALQAAAVQPAPRWDRLGQHRLLPPGRQLRAARLWSRKNPHPSLPRCSRHLHQPNSQIFGTEGAVLAAGSAPPFSDVIRSWWTLISQVLLSPGASTSAALPSLGVLYVRHRAPVGKESSRTTTRQPAPLARLVPKPRGPGNQLGKHLAITRAQIAVAMPRAM